MNALIPRRKKSRSGQAFAIETWLSIVSFALLVAPSVPPLRSLKSVNGWVKPYYYINYFDLGFIKRGLVGSLFTILRLNKLAAPSVIVVASHAVLSAIVAYLFWKLAAKRFSNWPLNCKLPIYLVFLFSPALFLKAGFDFGRMDLFCLAATLATLILFSQEPAIPFRRACWVAGISISAQLLIHDASLLFYSPLIFALLLDKFFALSNHKIHIFHLFLAIALPIAIGLAIMLWGQYEPGQESLNQFLARQHQELIGTMPMELTSSIRQNINMAMGSLSLKNIIGGSPLVSIYYLFLISLSLLLAGASWWIAVSIFSPLLVSLFALDHVRFLGISATSSILLAVYYSALRVCQWPKYFAPLLYVIAAFFFVFGPWGVNVSDALPFVKYFKFA